MYLNSDLITLAAKVGKSLLAQGKMLAVAESCTGGWVAKVITDVSGSSDWFEEGFVTYSNRAKQERLGVCAETLVRHGAVSEAAVAEMARGALQTADADASLAVSGIAGPNGGTADKPVGTVWFGWAARRDSVITVRTECRQFEGDREAIRRQAVEVALRGLLDG